MLRKLYDLTLSWAEHRHALWLLALVAFVESSVFPIPPDILMIPMKDGWNLRLKMTKAIPCLLADTWMKKGI